MTTFKKVGGQLVADGVVQETLADLENQLLMIEGRESAIAAEKALIQDKIAAYKA